MLDKGVVEGNEGVERQAVDGGEGGGGSKVVVKRMV